MSQALENAKVQDQVEVLTSDMAKYNSEDRSRLASLQGVPGLIEHAVGVARSQGASEAMLDPIIRLVAALKANAQQFENAIRANTSADPGYRGDGRGDGWNDARPGTPRSDRPYLGGRSDGGTPENNPGRGSTNDPGPRNPNNPNDPNERRNPNGPNDPSNPNHPNHPNQNPNPGPNQGPYPKTLRHPDGRNFTVNNPAEEQAQRGGGFA